MGLKKLLKRGALGAVGFALAGPLGGLALAYGDKILGYALKKLIKIPKIGDQLAEQGQDYTTEFRNTLIKIGDRRVVAYGECRIWFKAICTYPIWINNQQVLLFYGEVGRGLYDILDLNLATTPIGNFGQQRSIVLAPNEPLPPDFMHSNMFVSSDVGEQDLQPGGSRFFDMASTTVTVTTGTTPGTSRLTLNNFFDGVYVDSSFVIHDGPSAGSYTVLARDAGAEPDWVEISPTIPNGSLTSAFSWVGYESDGVTITVPKKDAPAVSLTFSAGPDQVRGPADSLSVFNPNDLLVVQGGSNDGQTFTVAWTNGDDTLGLIPAPNPETTTSSTLRLLRRRLPAVYGAPRGERTESSTLVFCYRSGLGFAKGEDPNDRTIVYELRWRSVDDAGNPLTAWTTEFFEQTDRTTNKPVYIEHTVNYGSAIRPELTVARITYLPDDSRYVDNATWVQLRSPLEAKAGEDPANDPKYTRIALMVGVTGQLTGLQEQSINGLTLRRLPQYIDGEWSEPIGTRNPVWAEADWLANESDGTIGYDDLDAESFAARAESADDRNVHFDAVIDAEVQYWETAQQIADRDRLVPYLDLNTRKIALARDEPSAPVAVFAHGFNADFSGLSIDTPTSQVKFGVRANFTDPATWQPRDEGPVYGDDADPRELQVFGCKEWNSAYDAAAFDYLDNRLRVLTSSMTTAREGLPENLRIQDRIWVCLPIGMGQCSEIVSLTGNTLRVRQPLRWKSGAQHYVILQGVGSPTTRINATRGANSAELVLESAPSLTLPTYGGPKSGLCLFGWDSAPGIRADGPRIAIVEDGEADGNNNASVQLRFDDARVHEPVESYPEDPLATVGTIPALALMGLTVTFSSGKWVASVTANPNARAYEFESKWAGELGYKRANFGSSNTAVIPADAGGVLMVRVRAWGDASFGPYTDPVSANVGGGALTVTLSDDKSQSSHPSGTRPTRPIIFGYATGGTPPYTYSWVRVAGDTPVVPRYPTNTETDFVSLPPPPSGETYFATFVLRATDSLGATADSALLQITIVNSSGP